MVNATQPSHIDAVLIPLHSVLLNTPAPMTDEEYRIGITPSEVVIRCIDPSGVQSSFLLYP